MNNNTIDFNFAIGWDKFEGNFSMKLANNLLIFGESNNKKIKSALDICVGSGNFLQALSNRGIKCFGTETEGNFIELCDSKLSKTKIIQTKSPSDIPFKDDFDIIACNNSTVNSFESFEEWKNLFKNAYKHLSNNGMFVFDYDTYSGLKDKNKVFYNSISESDKVLEIVSEKFDKSTFNYTYYIKVSDYMIKTKHSITKSFYENTLILNELKKVGFKKILTCNENLEPIEDIETAEKIFIIASKK